MEFRREFEKHEAGGGPRMGGHDCVNDAAFRLHIEDYMQPVHMRESPEWQRNRVSSRNQVSLLKIHVPRTNVYTRAGPFEEKSCTFNASPSRASTSVRAEPSPKS